MTYQELVKKVQELETRLEVKETALNVALNKVKELSECGSPYERGLKNEMNTEEYELLFDYSCDPDTGEWSKATSERKNGNFQNLYKNVLMTVGYRYVTHSTTKNKYYIKSMPIKELSDTEYKRFCKLMKKITEILAEYKKKSK